MAPITATRVNLKDFVNDGHVAEDNFVVEQQQVPWCGLPHSHHPGAEAASSCVAAAILCMGAG